MFLLIQYGMLLQVLSFLDSSGILCYSQTLHIPTTNQNHAMKLVYHDYILGNISVEEAVARGKLLDSQDCDKHCKKQKNLDSVNEKINTNGSIHDEANTK
eukprot:203569_1